MDVGKFFGLLLVPLFVLVVIGVLLATFHLLKVIYRGIVKSCRAAIKR